MDHTDVVRKELTLIKMSHGFFRSLLAENAKGKVVVETTHDPLQAYDFTNEDDYAETVRAKVDGEIVKVDLVKVVSWAEVII